MRGALRLFVVGAAQRVEQFADQRRVALFGAFDRLLREVIAQDVARVGGVHPRASRRGGFAVGRDAFGPARQPGGERRGVLVVERRLVKSVVQPLKIGRGENLQSLNTPGLYPGGEGASYAGGILSAGVDGIKVGEAVARSMLSQSL